jgi:hypothetical protein
MSERETESPTGCIPPGTRLRLRDDAFVHVKTREWIFSQIENGNEIMLMHENGLYGLVVRYDDIDWSKAHFTPKRLNGVFKEV